MRGMAPKKTNTKEASATKAPQDEVHGLGLIAAEIGKPEPAALEALLAGTTDGELVKVGRTILSSRIVTDAARIYGTAWSFYQGATAEQKRRLRGFSTPLLALAVQQALALQQLDQEVAGKTVSAGVARAAQEQTVSAATTAAVALRDQAYDALRDAAGQDRALRAEIEKAFGKAETSDTLANGLDEMATALRRWLAKKTPALSARLKLANLDGDYASELEDAAKTVRTEAARAQRQKAQGKVSQGTLDRADGINVLLMGQIIRAFEGAHGIDPTIPKLVPISTRRLFGRHGAKKTVGETPTPAAKPQDGEP
jgi:hypothetical protein